MHGPSLQDPFPTLALQALVEIERTGAVTDAARRLGVTQPAVSQAVSGLERRLGLALLRRGERPLRLTDEGATVARYARRADDLHGEVLARLDDLRRHRSGLVRIGSFGASASTRVLPGLLSRFARRHPGIAVQVREMPDPEALAALRAGEVDAAVLAEPSEEEFEMAPLVSDRLVGLLARDDPRAGGGPLEPLELLERPFVMTRGGSEALVRRWFAKDGVRPREDHAVQQIASILAFVRAGLGRAVVAELALPETHPGVVELALRPEAPRNVVLARRHGVPPSTAAEAFWRLAAEDIGG